MTEHAAATEQAVPLDEAFLRDFAERFGAAWNSHDPKQVQALCTEDVEYHDPTLPAPLHGWAGIAQVVDALATAFPDYRFEDLEPPYAAPDRPKAIAPWRFTGTMTGPLEPGWKTLLTEHSDRILAGLDVWAAALFKPETLDRLMRWTRRVLGELPPEAAARIAHANA